MLSQFIWSASIALEILLLARGLQQKIVSRYPVFYSYIAFVLVEEVASFLTQGNKLAYLYTYWTTEFVGVLLGCGIVFEIYRIGLAAYPGTARMARALLAVLFAIASVKTLITLANYPGWWLTAKPVEIESAIRIVQGVAIVSLIALFLFYSIPFGRNLRGILLGYGLFVSWSIVCLTVAAVSNKAETVWSFTYSGSYLVTLGLWAVHLWSYRASPVPQRAVRIELEYQRVAAATHRRLREARGYLAKAVGS
jgi:hypothetical protein